MNPSGLTFPPVIDSSIRSEFVSCPHAFFRRYIQGYQRRGRSLHLHFGAAFAAGLADYRVAIYRDGEDVTSALARGAETIIRHWGEFEPPFEDSPKNLSSCIGALEAMSDQYPPATDHVQPLILADGAPAVEFNGALPLPILHPETGEPLLYSGRFDQLARMGSGIYIEDDKTASQLGPSWGKNWRMRAQFSGYAWIARSYGYSIEGAIIRGVSILKRGFGHAEVIVPRGEWMVEQWYDQLLRDIRRMISCWKDGHWDQNLDSACASYGGCQFLDICASPNPDQWLQSEDFEVNFFDPLAIPEAD